MGVLVLSGPAAAGTATGEAAYCRIDQAPASSLFSLPANGGDPWARADAAAAVCGPATGAWTRSGPVHAWRPRRYHVALPGPRTPDASYPARPSAASAAVCGVASAARTIQMAAGPEVFDIVTVGAAPNSSVTLRIDNRTTVTITVNATPGTCSAAAYNATSSPDLDTTPASATSELLGAGFLTALNGPGPGPVATGVVVDGTLSAAPATQAGSGDHAVMEPSSMVLLGSGLMGLRMLIRRRKR